MNARFTGRLAQAPLGSTSVLPDSVARPTFERQVSLSSLLMSCLGWKKLMRTIALNWETAHQHGEACVSHHRLRYRMFIERQRWNVPNYRQLEYDEFDTPAATYILIVDDQNQALGTARLIPTTRPYMVEALWPDLVDGELPHLAAVWEA